MPIRWPESRDEVWQANVPHTFLATEKSDQHWMVVNGQKVNFPGGGTHFPNGADKYIASIAKVLIYLCNSYRVLQFFFVISGRLVCKFDLNRVIFFTVQNE